MISVFDQLDWTQDVSPGLLIQLVSTQLNQQDEIRSHIRKQLDKDYPPTALSWLPTVTWSAPRLVPLSSFDLNGIEDWPTWSDRGKIRTFTDKIEGGWHKPIVVVKTPGARYLTPIDGHTRLSVYWKLKRPVLAYVGKTHSVHGPWEDFHRQQRGMTTQQKVAGFASIAAQLIELSDNGLSVISEEQYRMLLAERRASRATNPPGHPERIAAERAVRQARKARGSSASAEVSLASTKPPPTPAKPRLRKLTEAESRTDRTYSELLADRRNAQKQYAPGHPIRVRTERDVRKARSKARSDES